MEGFYQYHLIRGQKGLTQVLSPPLVGTQWRPPKLNIYGYLLCGLKGCHPIATNVAGLETIGRVRAYRGACPGPWFPWGHHRVRFAGARP